jgi:hypothetical protein
MMRVRSALQAGKEKKKRKKEKQFSVLFLSLFSFSSVHDIRSALSQVARPAERATFRKKKATLSCPGIAPVW